MSQAPPTRRRSFQFSLATIFVVVAVAAIAVRTWTLVALGTIFGVGLIVTVFATTYFLLRQAQETDNRNSNANQANHPGQTPLVGG